MNYRNFSLVALCFLGMSSLKANESDIVLNKSVITATGFEQDADSDLRNTIVIYGEDLENKGYSSLEDALKRVGGISFVNIGTNNETSRNIDMRGQGGDANKAIKVMVDGISLNALDVGRLHAAGTSFKPLDTISLEDVERIEIIPGGGAVLYGSGTRGGVINIITKKSKKDRLALNSNFNFFENGNAGSELGANIAKVLNDNAAVNLNIQGFDIKGYQDGTKQKGYYANSKLLLDLGEDVDLNLNFAYYLNNDENSGLLSKEQIEKDPTQNGGSPSKSKVQRPELSADLKYHLNDSWDINALAFWQRQKTEIEDKAKGDFNRFYGIGSNFEDSIEGVNLKTKYAYKENSYLIFGYDFTRHNSELWSESFLGVTTGDDTRDRHSFFILDSHAFNDWFVLSGGARYEYADYDHHSTGKGYDFSGDTSKDDYALELTPTFLYSDTGKAYVKFEKGFILPTPHEFRQKKNGKYSINTDLKPESFITYEVGMSDYLWDFNEITLAAYLTDSKDEIGNRGYGHGGDFYNENLGKTRRYGFELGLKQYFENFNLYQNIAFVDATFASGENDGKRIPDVSKIKVVAGGEYFFTPNFKSFLDVTYFSSAYEDDRNKNKIDGYALVDLGLAYTYKSVQINGGVKNLLDKEYFAYQNGDEYSPGNGRSYHLGARFVF